MAMQRNLTSLEMEFKVDELIDIIRKNRENHIKEYEEAVVGYKLVAEKLLRTNIRNLKYGEKVKDLQVYLAAPQNYTSVYDGVIRMLELTCTDIIKLDASQFSNFVMDEWDWTQNFKTVNSSYATSSNRN